MNTYVLALIIIVQITVFQFLFVAFTRSLFTVRLGTPPGSLAAGVAAYIRKAVLHRFSLGAVLLLSACWVGLSGPDEPGFRKLLLAAISLISSVAFTIALVMDRRTIASMRDTLPESHIRHASLGPRTLRQWYHPSWEIVPVAVLLATAAFTVSVGYRLGEIPARMLVLQVLQGTFVIGSLFYSLRYGTATTNVATTLPMFRDHPDVALEFSEELAGRENRYFILAKIGVALLLANGTIRAGLVAIDHGAAPILGKTMWALIILLLAAFAHFIVRLVSLVRQAERRASHVNDM
jgi:hypothetical protein